MLSGDMPLVGATRFGVRPAAKTLPQIQIRIEPVPVPRFAQGGLVPHPAPKPAPRPAPGVYLSATKIPLRIGELVRGSDKSKNYTVDRNFRGTILEFIQPTAEGNNVRVKCSDTGKVYRVKNNELRKA